MEMISKDLFKTLMDGMISSMELKASVKRLEISSRRKMNPKRRINLKKRTNQIQNLVNL
jgi:hypothetical protein